MEIFYGLMWFLTPEFLYFFIDNISPEFHFHYGYMSGIISCVFLYLCLKESKYM